VTDLRFNLLGAREAGAKAPREWTFHSPRNHRELVRSRIRQVWDLISDAEPDKERRRRL
jgi:hypothetical protein